MWRSRWAAIGAAVAVALGVGGLGVARAAGSGDKPITVTIEPQRILDTRVDLGLPGRFVNETPRDLQVTGEVPIASGGTATVVPSDAAAVLVNVTVVAADSGGFLSLRPGGAAGSPTTSTVNFVAGDIVPNSATVDLGPGGTIQVFVKTAAPAGSADVLVDVVGYTIDHAHDDRYYTKAEIDGQPGTRMEWVNVGPSGTVRSNSPGLDGVTVVRPPTEPVGHYCIDVPSRSGLEGEAALGVPQRSSVTEVGRMISVTTTFANDCFVAGVAAFVAVEIFDSADSKVDNSFLLFIPRRD